MSLVDSVTFVMGPTASGKSDYAFELALNHQAEILSADAYQVYRGMDIGTAKPSAQMLSQVVHHLIDCREPNQEFDVAQFVEESRRIIADCNKRNVPLIITGGTNFYIHTLVEGLPCLPESQPDVRQAWQERAHNRDGTWLWEQLKEVDPVSAQRLHPNDQQRLIRALEVWDLSGKPLSSFRGEGGLRGKIAYRKLGISWPKTVLHQRVAQRTAQMIEHGLIEEVRGLIASGYGDCKALQTAVGYKETLHFLNHCCSEDELINEINQNTRHLVKKQLTWLKRDVEIKWISI